MSETNPSPSTEGGKESLVPLHDHGSASSVDNKQSLVTSWLDLLPPEVLVLILKKLKDPMDLLNCTRASPILDDLLQKQKPSVYFHLTLPHLTKYLETNDLLRCCQVSRSWMRAVDVEAMRFACKSDFWLHDRIYPDKESLFQQLWFGSTKEISSLLTTLNNVSPLNSSVYHHLNIHYDERDVLAALTEDIGQVNQIQAVAILKEDQQAFCSKSAEFFEKCGHLVTNFQSWISSLSLDVAKRMLVDQMGLFCLTPNLRELRWVHYGDVLHWEVDEQQVEAELASFLAQCVLPDLPHLMTIRLGYYCDPKFALHILDRYKFQVRHFEVNHHQLEEINSKGIAMPQLIHLEVLVGREEDVAILSTIVERSHCSLKKLKVFFDVTFQDDEGHIPNELKDAIVAFINRIESLEVLSLSVNHEWRILQELSMPNVIDLYLTTGLFLPFNHKLYSKKLYNNHSFWISFPKLKKLKLFVHPAYESFHGIRVKKTDTTKTRVYSREVYESLKLFQPENSADSSDNSCSQAGNALDEP